MTGVALLLRHFLIFQIFVPSLTAHEVNPGSYGIEHLLKPLSTFKIVIRLPEDDQVSRTASKSFLIEKTLQFLAKLGAPIQVFPPYHLPWQSQVVFTTTRHASNQNACLVFFPIHIFESSTLSTQQVLNGCGGRVEKQKMVHRSRNEDQVHLILIHPPGEVPLHTGKKTKWNLLRCSTPFYILRFLWFPPDIIPPQLIQAFDVCYSEPVCRMMDPPKYYSMALDGVTRVVQYVNNMRKDFHGDRILIFPHLPKHHVWPFQDDTGSLMEGKGFSP